MAGEDIPLAARIVGIADAFDAMATERPYKAALPLEECEALLRKSSGKMYDPELIDLFVSRHLGAFYFDSNADSYDEEGSDVGEVDADATSQ